MTRVVDDSLICDACGKTIEVEEGRTGPISSARYCSNACRQKAYRRRLKTNLVSLMSSGGMLTQLSSFVGRAEDLVELGRILRGTRLLTLTGPAGVGKTRLGVELAKKEHHRGRSEITLVELGAVTGRSTARQRIEAALGLGDDHGSVTAGASRGAVDNRERLLVLDNCEHVLDECGLLLGDLLARRTGLRIVATSREPLRIPGEVVYVVSGLPVAELGVDSAATVHLRSQAVRLFVDRARAVVPDLQLTDDILARIGAICRRLDGLPLAIELAAQLVRAFPLAEILAGLDNMLTLLVNGWRTADQRHRSWREALAWSYQLLTPPEQSLFRRLSVLPGGFGADAAAAVADDASAPSIPELLAALEAKSVILRANPREEETGSARFEMLESIRCYAAERLAVHREDDLARDRMVTWLVELAQPWQTAGITAPENLPRLGEERENLRSALEWATSRGDERGLVLAGAFVAVQPPGERDHEAERLVREALGRVGPHSSHREDALEALAVLALRRGDHGEAQRLLRRAIASARSRGRYPLLSRLLLRSGRIMSRCGEHDSALMFLFECQSLSGRLGDSLTSAVCLGDCASNLLALGDLERAAVLMDRCLSLVRPEAPPEWAASILHTAGALALERGELAEAEAYFAESLRSYPDDPDSVAGAAEGMAVVAVRTLQFERGLRLIAAAEAPESWARGDRSWWRARVEGAWSAAMNALPGGRAERALNSGRGLNHDEIVACVLGDQRDLPVKKPGGEPLSPREWEVIELVVKGLTNRQIAARMHLSVRTVETHMRNIRTVLGLRSRSHVAAWGAHANRGAVTPA